MSRSSRFRFVDNLDHAAAETADVVEIPAGLTNKRQLMQTFVQSMPLPDYFGGNWDALDECLRDRLTDEGRQPLCLLHRDLPMDQDAHDCREYLSLLDDTLLWAQETAACNFTVIFPAAAARGIERLVGLNESS